MKVGVLISIILSVLGLIINLLISIAKFKDEGGMIYLIFIVTISITLIVGIGMLIWVCLS